MMLYHYLASQARKEILSNSKVIIEYLRGRNVIITSNADGFNQIRGCLDVITIGSILRLSRQQAAKAIGENCAIVLKHAKARKLRYSRVEIVNTDDLLIKNDWLKVKLSKSYTAWKCLYNANDSSANDSSGSDKMNNSLTSAHSVHLLDSEVISNSVIAAIASDIDSNIENVLTEAVALESQSDKVLSEVNGNLDSTDISQDCSLIANSDDMNLNTEDAFISFSELQDVEQDNEDTVTGDNDNDDSFIALNSLSYSNEQNTLDDIDIIEENEVSHMDARVKVNKVNKKRKDFKNKSDSHDKSSKKLKRDKLRK